MPAAALTHKPVLTGELVQLRPVMAADAPGLVALLRDEALMHSVGADAADVRGVGLGDLAAAQRWYDTCGQHADRLDLAVVDRATGGFIGETVLADLDADNASCTFRVALLGPYGQGHRVEAARLLLAHAFDVAGMYRLEARAAAHEAHARAAYEAVGFTCEGTLREALAVDGTRVDVHVLAALADEADVG